MVRLNWIFSAAPSLPSCTLFRWDIVRLSCVIRATLGIAALVSLSSGIFSPTVESNGEWYLSCVSVRIYARLSIAPHELERLISAEQKKECHSVNCETPLGCISSATKRSFVNLNIGTETGVMNVRRAEPAETRSRIMINGIYISMIYISIHFRSFESQAVLSPFLIPLYSNELPSTWLQTVIRWRIARCEQHTAYAYSIPHSYACAVRTTLGAD